MCLYLYLYMHLFGVMAKGMGPPGCLCCTPILPSVGIRRPLRSDCSIFLFKGDNILFFAVPEFSVRPDCSIFLLNGDNIFVFGCAQIQSRFRKCRMSQLIIFIHAMPCVNIILALFYLLAMHTLNVMKYCLFLLPVKRCKYV